MSTPTQITLALSLALGLFGCSKSEEAEKPAPAKQAESPAEAPAKAPAEKTAAPTEKVEAPAAAALTKLRIEGNDQMKFNLAELRVKAGAKVELTLVHTGKLPKTAMGHNWVLLQKGTDVAGYATAAMQAKDTDYIPAAKKADVLAYTATVGGGEETRVTFTAPAAGEYDFICTFPGHYALMKGKLIVEG